MNNIEDLQQELSKLQFRRGDVRHENHKAIARLEARCNSELEDIDSQIDKLKMNVSLAKSESEYVKHLETLSTTPPIDQFKKTGMSDWIFRLIRELNNSRLEAIQSYCLNPDLTTLPSVRISIPLCPPSPLWIKNALGVRLHGSKDPSGTLAELMKNCHVRATPQLRVGPVTLTVPYVGIQMDIETRFEIIT